jgi:hypothetical protein
VLRANSTRYLHPELRQFLTPALALSRCALLAPCRQPPDSAEKPKRPLMQSESAKRSRDFSQGCQAQERILLMSSAEGALDFEGASRPGEIFRSVGRPNDHFQHHEPMQRRPPRLQRSLPLRNSSWA